MSCIVIYKSAYGSTKRYAEMLAKALGCGCTEVKKANMEEVKGFDTVIYGGGLYAGGVNGYSFIKKNADSLKGKKLAVFTVGAAAPSVTDYTEIDGKLALPGRDELKIFHLRGGMDYNGMSFLHKAMMNMLKSSLKHKKPEELSDQDKDMLEAFYKKSDFVDEKTLQPIIKYVRG